jgi:hypothetical protein
MTAPGRVKRAAFFLPPRAMIFALFFNAACHLDSKRGQRLGGPLHHKKEKKNSQGCEPDEHTCLLRALACKTGCWLVTHDCAVISLVRIVSVLQNTLVWFLLSHTAAAQLLASSYSPLRFAWTTGRRSARGISVRLASCSRSPALADLTTDWGQCLPAFSRFARKITDFARALVD